MAISLVRSAGTYSNSANTRTATFAAGGTATAGNLLVATAGTTNGIINTPGGWTVAATNINSFQDGRIFYKVAAGGETGATVTTSALGGFGIEVMEFSGLSSWTLDKSATLDTTTDPAGTGSTGTLSGATELAIALVSSQQTPGSRTWTQSFTTVFHGDGSNTAAVTGYLATSSTSALSPTTNIGTAGNNAGMIATFWTPSVTVDSDTDLRWTVFGVVDSDTALRWSVAGVVDSDTDLRWSTDGPVSSWSIKAEADLGGDPLVRPASMTDLGSGNVGPVTLNTSRGTKILSAGFETGTGSGKFDNVSGAFDPTNSASPFYPDLRPRVRTRYSVTVGGTDNPIHTGYAEHFVNQWRRNYSAVALTTQDAFGLTSGIVLPPSVLDIESRTLADVHGGSYYPMVETDFTGIAADITGGRDGAYIGAPSQGSPATDFDGRSNPRFAKPGTVNGDAINATAMQVTGLSVPDTFSFACWFRWDPGAYDNVNQSIAIFQQGSPVQTDPAYPTATPKQVQAYLGQDSGISGRHHINIRIQDGSSIAIVKVPIAAVVLNGQPHHLAFTITGSTRSVGTWIDGAGVQSGAVDTGVASSVPISSINVSSVISSLNTMGVGWGIDWNNVTGATAGVADSASVGHALYLPSYSLTATDIDALYAAGSVPWDGDTTGERIERVLDLVGIDAGDRDIDTGTQICGPTKLASQNAQGYLKKVVATELGEFFVNADGMWRFIERRASYPTTTQIFSDRPDLDGGAAFLAITTDYSYDRIVNDVVVQLEDGSQIEVTDAASIALYGQLSGTKYRIGQTGAVGGTLNTLHQSVVDARATAQWLIDLHKDPVVYIPALTVDAIDDSVGKFTLLGIEIGDAVEIFTRPLEGASIHLVALVENVDHNFTADGRWQVTYSLTDAIALSTPLPLEDGGGATPTASIEDGGGVHILGDFEDGGAAA